MPEKTLYIGTKGTVAAYDKDNGVELWRTHLRGSSYVMLAFDDEQIYAHTGGHLFCLGRSSGEIRWENSLSGLGYGLATLLVEGGQFNNDAIIHVSRAADLEREESSNS